MKKQIRVEESIDYWKLEGKAHDVAQFLMDFDKSVEIEIYVGSAYDDPYVEVTAFYYRDETDEECCARLAKEKRREEANKAYKIEQYLKLKKELEGELDG